MDLLSGWISDQWEVQVFVVAFSAGGEGEGWRLGALGRWRSGGFLGGIWEESVDWSEGNSGVGCVGFTVGVSGDVQVNWGGSEGWNGREMVGGDCWVSG